MGRLCHKESTGFKPDIIIIYNFPAVATSKLIKYCKKNKIKIIGDITEWYGHKVRNFLGIIKYIDSELRMLYYNKNLDGLICISKYLCEYYKKSVKNMIQLPPLVDISDEKWNVDFLPKKDKKVIVYAGLPGRKDKINKLIEAFLNIENISELLEFRIIGITEDDFFSKYNYFSEVQLNNIKSFSVFLGRIQHKKVIKEVTNADFSAFLRENNKTNNAGFPTKFVESISCGTPVITNNTSDLSDYLTEGVNGFWINMSNKEKLSSNLRDILDKKNKTIETMKRKCSDSKKFDYKNYINEIKKLWL